MTQDAPWNKESDPVQIWFDVKSFEGIEPEFHWISFQNGVRLLIVGSLAWVSF
jgi:hypothetical protein